MLKQRVITAFFLVAIVVVCLFFLPVKLFAFLGAGLVMLGAYEWGKFIAPKRSVQIISALVSLIVIAGSWSLYTHGDMDHLNEKSLQQMFSLCVLWWLFCVWMISAYPTRTKFCFNSKIFKMLAGLLTLLPFYWALMLVYFPHPGDAPLHLGWGLLSVIVLIWIADTGAYFCGRALGKNKLAPNVSPGKTREGMVGGVVLAMLGALILGFVLGLDEDGMFAWLVSSLAAVLFSVVGDLTESMFKREAKIKDSGRILPGHGGVLDRIDSLTAALPLFVFFFRMLS